MEDNNYFLRITGIVNIPVPLEVDHDYGFSGNISIYGSDSRSNQDGTQSITFKAQFTDEVQLIKGEQTVLAKSKLSQSQKFRRVCNAEGEEYDDVMSWVLRPETTEWLLREYRIQKV